MRRIAAGWIWMVSSAGLAMAAPAGAQAYNIRTVAGAGPMDGPATAGALAHPWDVAVDGAGNAVVVTFNRVYRISTNGALSVLAGDGTNYCPVDGGPAQGSGISNSTALAVDSAGRVYIAACLKVYRIDPANPTFVRIAGNGSGGGVSGDGGSALAASFGRIDALAVAPNGDVYVSDSSRIRCIQAASGTIQTRAGTGLDGYGGDGGPGASAMFYQPRGLAVMGASLLIADTYNGRVRSLNLSTFVVSLVAGSGLSGGGGDGGSALSASILAPESVAGRNGVVYIGEPGRVRVVDTGGIITTLAGGGSGGDGGPAAMAQLEYSTGLAVRANGDVLIAELGANRVRLVSGETSTISTLGGNGTATGDGPAARALMIEPSRVVVDSAGNAYVVERWGARVRRIDAATGLATTIAGTGNISWGGDGGPATAAFLAYPDGIAVDASGNVYVSDTYNNRVRRIDASTGIITTVAGNGTPGFSGDNGPATAASLNRPSGLAFGGNVLLIADTDNNRVRMLNMQTGIITTLAGTGTPGSGGDGGPVGGAQLNRPMGVRAIGLIILIADTGNSKLRGINVISGLIDTWPTNPTTLFSQITDVTIDPSGQALVVVESSNGRLRTIRTDTNAVATIAGGGGSGLAGDGGVATQARLRYPVGVAMDPRGALWVADAGNNRMRKLYLPPSRGDENGDRQADLLFREPSDGGLHFWAMNGTSLASLQDVIPGAPGPEWRVAGMGDFNGDEHNDLALWNSTTGVVEFWLLNGTQRIGSPVPLGGAAPLPVNWVPAAVADFDRDGRPDLLWRNTTSQRLVVWTLLGTDKRTNGNLIPNPDVAADANWRVVAAADMNADGFTDLVWQNGTSANVVLWLMNSSLVRTAGVFTNPTRPGDANWTLSAAADLGVGPGGIANTVDLVWRNNTSGNLVVWHMDLAATRTAGVFTTPLHPDVANWELAGPH